MKHTKKWCKIMAGTLALTGAIATPIALTSCSENGPVDPISTYRIGVYKDFYSGTSESITNNTLDISYDHGFTLSQMKLWFFLANKENQDILNDYTDKQDDGHGGFKETLALTCNLTIDDRKNIPESNIVISKDSNNNNNWYLGSLNFSATSEEEYNTIFKDKSIVVTYEVFNPNGNFTDGTGTIQENLTINFK